MLQVVVGLKPLDNPVQVLLRFRGPRIVEVVELIAMKVDQEHRDVPILGKLELVRVRGCFRNCSRSLDDQELRLRWRLRRSGRSNSRRWLW